MAALTCTATFPALRIAGGARCVCVLSTVYRTFRSRRRPRTPNLAAITTSARPAIAEGSQDFRTQLRRLLPLPYRVDGDPVSGRHEQSVTPTHGRFPVGRIEWAPGPNSGWLTAPRPQSQPKPWECPRCRRINAWWLASCKCRPAAPLPPQ